MFRKLLFTSVAMMLSGLRRGEYRRRQRPRKRVADYDHLVRENILLVTDEGWVHNEHNRKMASDGTIVAYELGWITYSRLPDQHCEVAIDLFSANTERE
jgi:hypothetical protein